MTTTPEKRNPACDIPGCDCQNGPPIERCAECGAASPHHFDSCSHYARPLPKSEALLTARPPASGPTPTPQLCAECPSPSGCRANRACARDVLGFSITPVPTPDIPDVSREEAYGDPGGLIRVAPVPPSSSLGAATATAESESRVGFGERMYNLGFREGLNAAYRAITLSQVGGSPTGAPGEEQPADQWHEEKTENGRPQGLVLSREASRETDALVAERVMRWRFDDGPRPPNRPWRLRRERAWYRPGCPQPVPLAFFSADISAAWLVQEELQRGEWELSLDYEAPGGVGGAGWCATFGHHLRDAVFAYATTAPLAICRAALLAVEAQ